MASMEETFSHSRDSLSTSSHPDTAVAIKMEDNHFDHGNDISSDSDIDHGAEITELAKKMSRRSAYSTSDTVNDPFNPAPGSKLDPLSENFKPRLWVRSLLHLKSRDPEKFPDRTAGIAFRNLNVYGYGDSTDYQKSVANVWLGLGGLFRMITRTQRARKIDILQEFDGLVQSGEMLVVLGPPGSGCSTLLKTIAGETHGIYIGEESELNYQGMIKKSP